MSTSRVRILDNLLRARYRALTELFNRFYDSGRHVRFIANTGRERGDLSERDKLNEYTLINMKLSQDITKNLTVYGGVDNINDTDYEMSYCLPSQGRFVYGGFKVKF